MILTIENTAEIGKPIRLFDSKGEEILYPIEADTVTGVVCRYCCDGVRRLVLDGDRIRRETKTYPAPLQVVWLEK